MTVAFSRSSRPTRPISWDSETASPGRRSRRISAARSSVSAVSGLKIEVTAAEVTPAAPRASATLASSSGSNGEISRPSNSWPPWHRKTCPPIASTRACGQPDNGGTPAEAGSPSRIAAVRANPRACTTALVKWVVPIATA